MEAGSEGSKSKATLYGLELKKVEYLRISSAKKYLLVPFMTLITIGIIHYLSMQNMSVMRWLWYYSIDRVSSVIINAYLA
jgi:hypothetical protein